MKGVLLLFAAAALIYWCAMNSSRLLQIVENRGRTVPFGQAPLPVAGAPLLAFSGLLTFVAVIWL